MTKYTLNADDYHNINQLITNTSFIMIGIPFALFWIFLGICGFIEKDTNGILGGITMLSFGIFAVYNLKNAIKKEIILTNNVKKEKKIIITLSNLGVFLNSLGAFTVALMLVLTITGKMNDFIFIFLVLLTSVEEIVGAILQKVASELVKHDKNTKLFEIKHHKNNK